MLGNTARDTARARFILGRASSLVKHAFRPSRVTLSRPRAAMQTLTSRVPPVVAESWRVSATRRRTVSPRRGVPAKAGDNAEIKTAEPVQARESRKEGRPVYSPDSYQDICYHVYRPWQMASRTASI